MNTDNYTIDYFIEKFEAIPLKNWVTGSEGFECIDGKACALGFCGITKREDGSNYVPTKESSALIRLFGGIDDLDWKAVYRVNDGFFELKGTPKERVLNKLKLLKP